MAETTKVVPETVPGQKDAASKPAVQSAAPIAPAAEEEFLLSLLPELDAMERRALSRRADLAIAGGIRKVSDRIIARAEEYRKGAKDA